MKAIERLFEYFDYKKIKPTRFEKDFGLSNGYLAIQLKRKADIGSSILELVVNNCRDLNVEWLLTGNGVMINENKTGIIQEIRKQEDDPKLIRIENEFPLRSDSRKEIQFIPLYDLEAAAGLVPLFNEASKPVPLDYIAIPNLPKCDGAIYVVGDSMYPLLKSGDIVLYKQVIDIANNIFFGEMYLLSLDMSGEEYVVVKYIQKSELPDHVKLVSYNSHHSEKDVRISSIRALAFIKASIRINSMI